MAFCLILVGQFNQRDGLLTTGFGLLAHALAYVGYTVYGHAPLWLTYGAANTLLAVALAFYGASVFRIVELPVSWWRVFAPAALMLVLMASLIDTLEPRMLAATLVLMVQCALIIYWTRRHIPAQGRARMLLIIGSSISLIGLGMRVVAVLGGGAEQMRYDASNLKQTISVSIGTFTAMMISLGLVLLSKERSETLLQHLALRDVLTGILNRRAILEQFSTELERSRRDGSYLAVAMVDIDHFKQINDEHGHLAGDEVICHCVNHLTQRIRHSDSIGRYGGEEFCCCCQTLAPREPWPCSMNCGPRWPSRRRTMLGQPSRCASVWVFAVWCLTQATPPPPCSPGRMRRFTRPRVRGAIPCAWRRPVCRRHKRLSVQSHCMKCRDD